jgi:hypothetical protein
MMTIATREELLAEFEAVLDAIEDGNQFVETVVSMQERRPWDMGIRSVSIRVARRKSAALAAVVEEIWPEAKEEAKKISPPLQSSIADEPTTQPERRLIEDLRAISPNRDGDGAWWLFLEQCFEAVEGGRLTLEEWKGLAGEWNGGLDGFDEALEVRKTTGAWLREEVLEPEIEEKAQPGPLAIPGFTGKPHDVNPEDFTGTSVKYLSLLSRSGLRTLHRWQGSFWDWRGTHYGVADEEKVRNTLYQYLKRCVVTSWDKKGKPTYAAVLPNKNMINNMLDALKAEAFLPSVLRPGFETLG